MGWQGILYRRIHVDFSFLTMHKVCTKARLLGERSVRIRKVKGSNPSRSIKIAPVPCGTGAIFISDRRDSKSTTLRSRVSNQPSGLLLSATGCGSQRLLHALRGVRILLAAAPTTPPCFCRRQRSSLLQVPPHRNVYRGCWIRRDSKRAATTAAYPLPFYCSTLLSRIRSLSRFLPAFSRNFSSRSSTVILLRSSPFTSNTMRPLSIIRVRLPSSNA